ncbi:MAG TPA: chorismate mutase [Tissierellaceae bacterium]|nr:chorismate mutase [Tissierellaceae bacterium]
MISIRGAITVENNTKTEIINATKRLIKTIESTNNLNQDKVISMIFSCTNDLNKVAPSKAARDLDYTHIGLMNFNEMQVDNGLQKCIRVMILYDSDKQQNEIKHIYLKKAVKLRPDLVPKDKQK